MIIRGGAPARNVDEWTNSIDLCGNGEDLPHSHTLTMVCRVVIPPRSTKHCDEDGHEPDDGRFKSVKCMDHWSTPAGGRSEGRPRRSV